MQVYESVRTYGKHLPLFAEAIFGGVSINPQIQKIRRGTDIVVATPGRLLDLIQQQHLDLSRVEHFVLDEADRMLDMASSATFAKSSRCCRKNGKTCCFPRLTPRKSVRWPSNC